MSKKSEIKDAIKKLVEKPSAYSVVCTVDSIDLSDYTCYCVTKNGSGDIQGVRLQAKTSDGLLIIPEVDSEVVVSFLSDSSAYISMFSEIKEVILITTDEINLNSDLINLNGDNYGGLAKTGTVATKFNTLETQENAFKLIVTAILNAGISSPGTPVTNASLAAYFKTYNVTAITPTTQSELSNSTVKHGNS